MKALKALVWSISLACISVAPLLANAELPPVKNGKVTNSLAPMLKNVLPAVVNIAVIGQLPAGQRLSPHKPQKSDPAGPQNQGKPQNRAHNRQHNPYAPSRKHGRKFMSVGSGVIVNAAKGYIVTNAHVIKDEKNISVTLKDGRQFNAKLVGVDPASDIAVIQIKADHLQALQFANSAKLDVGDFVVAIGNPFGLSQSVTSGIVSGLGRSNLGIEGYENFIQTDAPINPGNSGGALVNLQGQLVGINTAILSPEGGNIGIGFAIPSDMVKSVMAQLIKYGSVRRGMMGVMIQNFTPNLAQALHITPKTGGAIVSMVTPNSPAAKAGFKRGDIIEKINGAPIKNAAQVSNIVGLLRVGSTVNLQVLRNNKIMKLQVTTASAKQYHKESQHEHPFFFGTNLRNFDQYTTLHGNVKGVQITGVAQGSPAWHARPVGLRPGDVIISANQKPVQNVQQLMTVAKQSQKELALNILRGTGAMFVVVK